MDPIQLLPGQTVTLTVTAPAQWSVQGSSVTIAVSLDQMSCTVTAASIGTAVVIATAGSIGLSTRFKVNMPFSKAVVMGPSNMIVGNQSSVQLAFSPPSNVLPQGYVVRWYFEAGCTLDADLTPSTDRLSCVVNPTASGVGLLGGDISCVGQAVQFTPLLITVTTSPLSFSLTVGPIVTPIPTPPSPTPQMP